LVTFCEDDILPFLVRSFNFLRPKLIRFLETNWLTSKDVDDDIFHSCKKNSRAGGKEAGLSQFPTFFVG
jgi:hypothetical protein